MHVNLLQKYALNIYFIFIKFYLNIFFLYVKLWGSNFLTSQSLNILFQVTALNKIISFLEWSIEKFLIKKRLMN